MEIYFFFLAKKLGYYVSNITNIKLKNGILKIPIYILKLGINEF